ncbi:unnamed protein product, partial [Linum tenue]
SLARSVGAVAKLIAKEGKSTTLKLSYGEVRLISKNCSATVGQVGNVGVNQKSLGRAGSKCWLDKRPVVKGVVTNPIDHPHGAMRVVKGGPQLVEKNLQPFGIILHLEEEVEKGINMDKLQDWSLGLQKTFMFDHCKYLISFMVTRFSLTIQVWSLSVSLRPLLLTASMLC